MKPNPWRSPWRRAAGLVIAVVCVCANSTSAVAQDADPPREELQQELEALKEREAENRRRIAELERRLEAGGEAESAPIPADDPTGEDAPGDDALDRALEELEDLPGALALRVDHDIDTEVLARENRLLDEKLGVRYAGDLPSDP